MKILVINIKYLGDLIVSTPGLHALRQAHPDDEIVFLLRKGFEDVLNNNPNINRIITFNPAIKGNKGFGNIIKGIQFINKIRKEKFDVVIALHPGDRIAFWAWFSGAKMRIAPRKQSFGFLFNKKVNVEEDSISYLVYYNKIFGEFIGSLNFRETEFFFSAEDKLWVDKFLKANSIGQRETIIGFHPGASEPTKIWPAKNYIELLNLLKEKGNIKIVLIEGPQDKTICDEITSAFKEYEIIRFVSQNIGMTGALLKKCNLLITHDTGTRHLSVAVETPVLALLPEDNLNFWNFYDEVPSHFCLVGKRFIGENIHNKIGFLGSIAVNSVYKKIGEILKLW